MMWTKYRRWKSWIFVGLIVVAYALMQLAPEGSGKWKAGIFIGLGLGMAYVAEEVFWIVKRQGRPCGSCGQKVQMRAFSLMTNCPKCGQPLE